MNILRTPDENFQDLEDYPFEPHYVDVDGPRMHYVDEPGDSGITVLMLHGEPSWSYLYRKMIPPVNAAGHRVIAPDLIGFGKSDKPAELDDYTYQSHLDWLGSMITKLELENIVLFCQDWGGLLGLRYAMEDPERFIGIIAANTMLPTGDVPANEAFMKWKNYALNIPEFDSGKILQMATVSGLSEKVMKAYNAPFPDESFKAGARKFPALVPVTPDDPASEGNRDAWKKLMQWDKPFLTAFSDKDPIMSGLEKFFMSIPGAKDQNHVTIRDAGHFLQEDKGEELAEVVVEFIEKNL
jgi:haloalkane dehalogenase